MRFSDILRTAIFSLRGNWMRSALTSLGVIIGIAAVIVMVSVGQGTQAQIDKQMSGLGAQRLDIMPGSGKGPPGAGGARQSASSFFTRRGRRGGHPRAGARGAVRGRSAARQRAGGVRREQRSTSWQGVQPDFFSINSWTLDQGQLFDTQDYGSAAEGDPRRHRAQDAVRRGQRHRPVHPPGPGAVRGGRPLKPKGPGSFGQDQDDVVMVPLATGVAA
jgi:putative ABC transport system permease protein